MLTINYNLDMGFSKNRPYTYSNWNEIVTKFPSEHQHYKLLNGLVKGNFFAFVAALIEVERVWDNQTKEFNLMRKANNVSTFSSLPRSTISVSS